MTDCVEIIATGPHAQWAADLANVLVDERLAACAHVVPDIRAVYRWEGRIEHAPESRLAVHTRADLVDVVTARIVELHEDEVPCVMALPILGGSRAYLEWIVAETTSP